MMYYLNIILLRYTKSSRFSKMGYEEDFHRYLQSLVSDCERRIKRGHQRLALSNQQGSVSICLLFNQL